MEWLLLAAANATHNNVTLTTDRSVYDVTHYILGGAYFVLTLATLGLAAYKYATGSLAETWKQGFFLFVMLGSAMRGCWAVFGPLVTPRAGETAPGLTLFCPFLADARPDDAD